MPSSSTQLPLKPPPSSKRTVRSKSTRSALTRTSTSRGSVGSGSESQSETDLVSLMFTPPVKSRFSSEHFLKASKIIRSIRNPEEVKEGDRPVFWSDEERILTYELIVGILKYSSFLKEALDKSRFYVKNPHLLEVGQEYLLVLLYDLIEREFRVSPEDTPLPHPFSQLQTAILESKTKLMAHIAKLRIKHEATTLENLLPTNLRHKHNIDKNPLYFWINLKKMEMVKIVVALRTQGLQETRFEDDTLIQENLFCISKLHPDLVRLNSNKAAFITSLPMFRDGKIVVQDKSACLPVYVLAKALYYREALYHRGAGMENLNPFPFGAVRRELPATLSSDDNNDGEQPVQEEWYEGILEGAGRQFSKPECVVVTHCCHGRSVAHLAILLSEGVPRYLSRSVNMSTTGSDLVKSLKRKFVYKPPLTVVAFGAPSSKHDEISKYIKKTLGVTNVRLYSENFINVRQNDPRIRGCGAILVNPPSSGSALKDPVAYICSEGGDEQILTQFSNFMSSAAATGADKNGNRGAFSPTQAKYLNHALAIRNVKLVLYTTYSNLTSENGEVIKACLGEARRREEAKKCQFYASLVMAQSPSHSKLFREVTYELVPLDKLVEGYDKEACLDSDFVDMHPSSACSGVFMALIRRRDRQVTMARDPVKQYVASQIKVKSSEWSREGGDQGSKYSSGTPSLTMTHTPISPSLDDFTEDELAQHLIRKLKLDSKQPLEQFTSSAPSSIIPVFQATMKKKASKKAIVKRVSTPTHSSLQRQTEKYYMGGVSSPNSGSQTPSRAQTRRKSSGGSGPGSRSQTPSRGSQQQSARSNNSGPVFCPNHHLGGHMCICARHAKKFPELLKNL